jgi:Purple acid Phosphatase, N-terminal domain
MDAWGSYDPHAPFFKATALGLSMNGLLLKLAIVAAVGSLLASTPAVAQEVPLAEKTGHVEIIQGPSLEIARENSAIVRWITNNPGGSDGHFAIAYYGTDPKDLSQTAKSPLRINRGHPETIFRVLMPSLKPRTTYYYKVTSTESNGESDGVESAVNQFTTPGPGERIVNYPPQPAGQK